MTLAPTTIMWFAAFYSAHAKRGQQPNYNRTLLTYQAGVKHPTDKHPLQQCAYTLEGIGLGYINITHTVVTDLLSNAQH